MKIKKMDGSLANFMPNKILKRIKMQSKGLNVSPDLLFQKVIPHIVDEITTTEIDEIIAFKAADLQMEHPDYSLLGGRILMTRQSKILNLPLEDVDLELDFFAASTFLAKYSKKGSAKEPLELISTMFERVCEHLYKGNTKHKKELLDELKSRRGNFATPVYTNSGIDERNSLISCNLTTMLSDSREGIQETLNKLSSGSKEGSGIGLQMDCIRSEESLVSSFNNNAGGIVGVARMIEATMQFYKQGERSGSCAMYLSTWHRDIDKFLKLTLPVGSEKQRTRDLFTAVVIDDLFMNALISDKPYYTFCPNDIKKAGLTPLQDLYGKEFEEVYNKAVELGIGKQVSAKKIWDAIITSQVESGKPYIFYKDNANKRNMQCNIGVVNMLNLCVHGSTKILTDRGYLKIGDLVNKEVSVWNGRCFTKTTVKKTGENQKLLKVTTNSGQEVLCTPAHKFYSGVHRKGVKNTSKITEIRASELKRGDSLLKFDLPTIEGTEEMKYPYTQGFYCGDGYRGETPIQSKVYLYGAKSKLLENISVRKKKVSNGVNRGSDTDVDFVYNEMKKNKRVTVYPPVDMEQDKSFVPNSNFTIDTRLSWLAGIFDSDGSTTFSSTRSQSIQLTSTNIDFLKKIQLMLQTLGVYSKVIDGHKGGVRTIGKGDFLCKATFRILINGTSTKKLLDLGLNCRRLKFGNVVPNRRCEHFIKIDSVEVLEGLHDTYCFTEEERGMGMFNGILTGNCAEISQVSKPGYTPQCALASINLAEQNDLESIAKTARVLTRGLNRVIDVNKWSDEWSKNAGEDQRAIAIGVAGMADFFAKRKISFESDEAKEWTKMIFETIYKSFVKESCAIAIEQGKNYPAYSGSLYEKGETYIKGWSPFKEGAEIPMYNSLGLGLMPTASSAILLSVFEAFGAPDSNAFTRTVSGGEFLVVNKYLINELIELGLWNQETKDLIIANDGSVQNIPNIPDDLKYRYKTIWEIPQKAMIDLAIIRNKFVDQSQSMNLYFATADYKKISSAQVYAWKNGLKTGVYYTRTKSKQESNKKLSSSSVKVEKPKGSIFDCAGGGCGA